MASAGILGVVILALYGDRTPYYQHPMTYQQSYTKLTPLGQAQEVQLGQYLRAEYLNPNSLNAINGIATEVVDDRQLLVRADNGGEGGAILDSAVALLQGLYPPTPRSRTSLANGTTVIGPMNGYQYVPIESVEPIQSIQLEGWSSCPNFEKRIKKFYDSAEFKEKAKEAAPFLNAVNPYLYGIPNTLENMWNIYDYLNTNYIHNETYAFRLPPTFLQQAQYWVDYHEYGIFTDKDPNGIGNIAGRTILPSIISAMERIDSNKDPLSMMIQEISYKPLISLLNITDATEQYPYLAGLPTYGSALALEMRDDAEGETVIRTKVKNGTGGFETIHLFGHTGDIPLNELLYRLDLTSVGSTAQWCRICGQRSARGCGTCLASEEKIAGLLDSEGDDNQTCISRIINALSSPVAQIISTIAFACTALLALFKVYTARAGRPKLQGEYDPLPTSAQYFDEPTKGRGRF